MERSEINRQNASKEKVFVTTPEGCRVCTSHRHNRDGYLRVRIETNLIMFHRHVWQEANGDIPEGYEINHKCRNRACSNLEHLELVARAEHIKDTNDYQYAYSRYWQRKGLNLIKRGKTRKEVASLYGISKSAVDRWVKKSYNDNMVTRWSEAGH